ncbi:MAG: hypothetical protein ABI591_15655 [Kofleriaceae bacterium]
MLNFFLAGGWMMFVVLATGIPLLATSAKFARTASPQGLSIIRALTMTVVFASIAGVVTDLAAVARAVPSDPELMKEPLANVLWGFNESMAPAILGFSLVTIAWILVAFGVRRMPHE